MILVSYTSSPEHPRVRVGSRGNCKGKTTTSSSRIVAGQRPGKSQKRWQSCWHQVKNRDRQTVQGRGPAPRQCFGPGPEVGGDSQMHRYAEWVLSIKALGPSPSTLLQSTSLLIEPSRALSASAFCPGSQLLCEYSPVSVHLQLFMVGGLSP